MSMNDFATNSVNLQQFVVQNIGLPPKTIKIFNYPIPYGGTRDLLRIPGIGEADIRVSLLKGELNTKIKVKQITILNSDIDLLQFNDAQRTFLTNAGITTLGTSIDVDQLVSGGGSGISANQHETLRQLIHFIDSGPGDGFASGAVREMLPLGSAFPTSIIWYLDGSLTTKLVEKLITYNVNQVPTTIVWNMYGTNGTTIVHSITDTISYTNNVFETTRTRTIT